MTQLKNPQKPTSLIIHGANFVGAKLVELLSAQKGNVILTDEFTKKNSEILKKLRKEYSLQTFDLSGIQSLEKSAQRIDYIFILLDQFLVTSGNLSSKKFLSETNTIDAAFKLAIRHSAKVILTTTLALHKRITSLHSTTLDNLSHASKQEPYNPVELQRYCENLAAEYHDQAGLDIRIARLGEIIGENMPLESNTTFVNMLKESITKPRITIPGEGLDYSYYIYILDAVYGLIKAIFSPKTNGEVFSLSYPEEISTLNLAYKVLELNPKANEIEFAEAPAGEGPQQIYVPAKNLSKIGWEPKVSFEQALMESLQYFHDQYHIKWKEKPTDPEEKIAELQRRAASKPKQHASDRVTATGKTMRSIAKPFNRLFGGVGNLFNGIKGKFAGIKLSPGNVIKYTFFISLGILIFLYILAPIVQISVGSGLTYYFGKKAYNQATQLDFQDAKSSIKTANYFAGAVETGSRNLNWLKYIPPAANFYEATSTTVSGVKHLVNGAEYLVTGLEPYAVYFSNFQPITSFESNALGGSRGYQTELASIENNKSYIDMASVEISLAKTSLKSVDTSIFPSFLKSKVDDLTLKTSSASDAVITLQSFATYLPELLGQTERMNYLVLFENPTELRSTGGWLTSYAIIGVEQGQLRQLTVDDVYNADGQLDQIIQPPASMSEALGVTQWNLALSNWSPDFPESAEAAEYFLKEEDKVVKVDGVISVDLDYIRDLVDIWGQIDVPGEDEPVTKDNMFDKIVQIHSQFTPGSTEKPEFISNLANEILKNLLQSSQDKLPQIAEKTSQALNEKHIQIYLHNSSINQVLTTKNWNGSLQSEPNLIYPVEWNWGGNKANYYLQRSTNYFATIVDENTINQKVEITYLNDSTENTYPQGEYKDFVRIYLPASAKVTEIKGIANSKQTIDSTIPAMVISGWANVPVSSSTTVSISYTLQRGSEAFPLTINAGNTVTYSLNYIKQAGLDADPLTISVTFPSAWKPLDLADMRQESNTLIQRTDLQTDRNIEITWQR